MKVIGEQISMEETYLRLSLHKVASRNVLCVENEVILYIELQRHKLFRFVNLSKRLNFLIKFDVQFVEAFDCAYHL